MTGLALLFSSLPALVPAASPDHQDPPRGADVCVACHGSQGTATQAAYPKLDGQRANYIVRQILDFQAGYRKDPVMSPIAENLERSSLNTIAAYFSRQPITSQRTHDTQNTDRGHDLYLEHRCHMCHHPKARRSVSSLPHGPMIAGQRRDYVIKALNDIRSYRRPADVFDLMHRSLGELSDADLAAMADYISTRTPAELQD